MNALGIVFSNIHDNNIPELTRERTVGSIPFCGRYRLIDFSLSNMVNSGIFKVGVITKSNYQSLMDHIGSGKDWDLARHQGGLHILPPYGNKDNVLYTTRLEALRGAVNFLERSVEDYVVMTDCDLVYSLDYSKLIKYHIEKEADITLVYKKVNANVFADAKDTVAVNVDDEGRVNCMSFDLKKGENIDFFTNICVMKRTVLLNIISDSISHNYKHFGKDALYRNLDILKIYGYELESRCIAVTSFQKYYDESMKLLDRNARNEVFRTVGVYTKIKDSSPTKYGKDVVVKNSLIADGCHIEGTVINSIIFRGVHVAKGAVVKNSIVMQGSYISSNASLNCIVTDKNVFVKDNITLSGCETHPFYIAKNSTIG